MVDDFDSIILRAKVNTEAHLGPFFLLEVYFKFMAGIRFSQVKLQLVGGQYHLHDTILFEHEKTGVDVVIFFAVRPGIPIVRKKVTAMA